MGRRILVIDDDADILSILELVLLEEGFDAILRQTGAYAAEIQHLDPELILLDVRISGYPRSGVEICKEFKSSSALKGVPVVLFSAEHNLPELAMDCGCDGYIRKPFDIGVLVDRINGFLKN